MIVGLLDLEIRYKILNCSMYGSMAQWHHVLISLYLGATCKRARMYTIAALNIGQR